MRNLIPRYTLILRYALLEIPTALILLLTISLFTIKPGLADQPIVESEATSQTTTEQSTQIAAVTFESSVEMLNDRSFTKKEQAIRDMLTLNDARVLKILEAMLDNQLYSRAADNRIIIGVKKDDAYLMTDVISSSIIESSEGLKKIVANNKIRRLLRASIAQLSLQNPDVSVRLSAINDLFKKVDDDTLELFRTALKTEKDSDMIDAFQTGIAIAEVKSDDRTVRLNALNTLSGSLLPEARNSIQILLEKNADGQYIETDAEIVTAAQKAMKRINERLEVYALIETLFFGLSLGSVLLLAAIGLAITFGVMGVINMAHGELIMLGAYTTYLVQMLFPNSIEMSLFIAIPAAFIVSGLFGIAIERGVIRFLYGRPLETLLATFGVSLILQQLVRVAISAQNVPVETPQWMSGTLQINNALSITYNRMYIVIFSLMVFFGLMMILKKTRLGLHVRAVSQNRSMAKAMGIRTEWVDAMTFGLGSGIAGIAGVALSQLTNVGPNLGQSYIIDSFMVVVFGGVGNLWGTLVGAMSLGVVNKFLEPVSGAVLAKILVLVFIILFIQKKPRGLFPQKGRGAEN